MRYLVCVSNHAPGSSCKLIHHTPRRGRAQNAIYHSPSQLLPPVRCYLPLARFSLGSILIFIGFGNPSCRRLDDGRYFEDPSPADQARNMDPSDLGSSVRRSCVRCVLLVLSRQNPEGLLLLLSMNLKRRRRFVTP